MVMVKAKGTKPALMGVIVEREVTLDEMLASLQGALPVTGLDHDVVGLDAWSYRTVVVECQSQPELTGLRVEGEIDFHNPLKVSDWMGMFTCYEAWKGFGS
jgi:hypothetical protein